MSKPATPRSRQAIESSAISRDRAWCRIAVSSCRTVMPVGGHALLEALLDGGDDLVEGEAGGDVLLGRVADLGVDDAVRRQVLDALARDPRQRGGGLHDRDGVVEGLEVLHQRAGVGHRREPLTQRLGVGSGQRVPHLRGQLDDRGRPQPPVEVVVQQHLRRPPDLLRGDHWPCTRFGQDGAHAAILPLARAREDTCAPSPTSTSWPPPWVRPRDQRLVRDRPGPRRPVRRRHRRPPVDPRRPGARRAGAVRRDHRARLPDGQPDPRAQQDHLQHRDRRTAAQLRPQQGPLPQPGQGRQPDPRTGHPRRAHRRAAGKQLVVRYTIEIEGEDKPACVAETVVLLLG